MRPDSEPCPKRPLRDLFSTKGNDKTRIDAWRKKIREVFGEEVDYDRGKDPKNGYRQYFDVLLEDMFRHAQGLMEGSAVPETQK